jgi:hypothetical protein
VPTQLNFVDIVEQTAPATPPAGVLRYYPKSDHKLYTKDSTGVETDLTATGAGGGGAVQTKTTTYTALSTDAVILADTSTGAWSLTLPAVSAGRTLIVKMIGATSNILTVLPASGTIDGAPSDSLIAQWQSRTYVSSATAWFKV